MKYIYSIVLILVFLCQTNAQHWIPPGDLPLASRYDDVFFVDGEIGWTGNSKGEIFKTIDGGDHWELVYTSDYYIRSIEFIDSQTGFAGTLDSVLLRTTNGGDIWTEIQDLIPGDIPGVCGMSHVGDTVFGLGIYHSSPLFIKSTDGGENWTYRDMTEYSDGLVDVHFKNGSVGYAGGIDDSLGGVILRTENGGENWEVVYRSDSMGEFVWKFDFVDKTTAYASLESLIREATILKTQNGGQSWDTHKVTDQTLDLQGIGFLDKSSGWAGSRHQGMYKNEDGGLTWYKSNDITNINSFFRLNEQKIYASGSSVFEYIEDTTDVHIPYDDQMVHKFEEVVPNPFTDELKIRINIGRSTLIKLDILAKNGTASRSIFEGRLQNGIKEFKLQSKDLHGLPGGPYLIYMQTNEGFLARKVIYVK